MKLRIASFIFLFFIVYCGISFYIGWNGWVFLSTLFHWSSVEGYSIVFCIIAFSYLIGRAAYRTPLRPVAEALKWIGSYWFAVLEYGVLLLPLANLAVILLRVVGVDKYVSIIGVGSIIIIILAALLVRGTWNAWSPVIRKYTIQIPKKQEK